MLEKIFHILTCNIYNEYNEDITSYNEDVTSYNEYEEILLNSITKNIRSATNVYNILC
jgi:hypothetical protein